jgi:hypothetical protein
MLSQAQDLRFGIKSEMSLRENIEKIVGDSLTINGGMSVFDYSNKTNTVYAELKTRRITHDRYDTAIIGKNKIDYCKPGVDYYFVFSYVDGLYYIKYDKALFDTFEVNDNYVRGERADCYNPVQTVVMIPTRLLVKYTV